MGWFWIVSVFLVSLFSQGSQPTKVDFPIQKIRIHKTILEVEVAQSPQQLERGLMYRTELKAGRGMIFVFDQEEPRHFWMKNTFIPLSIAYFDKNKKIVDIQDMKPVSSIMETPNTYSSRQPAKYALEVPKGWFALHKIKIGHQFEWIQTPPK